MDTDKIKALLDREFEWCILMRDHPIPENTSVPFILVPSVLHKATRNAMGYYILSDLLAYTVFGTGDMSNILRTPIHYTYDEYQMYVKLFQNKIYELTTDLITRAPKDKFFDPAYYNMARDYVYVILVRI